MADIVPAVVSDSPSGQLDKVNLVKIVKGFLINLGGAILTAIVIQLFPDIVQFAQNCVGDNSVCNGITPGQAQLIIFLVPVAATVVNSIKEWLTDYRAAANRARIENLGQ